MKKWYPSCGERRVDVEVEDRVNSAEEEVRAGSRSEGKIPSPERALMVENQMKVRRPNEASLLRWTTRTQCEAWKERCDICL